MTGSSINMNPEGDSLDNTEEVVVMEIEDSVLQSYEFEDHAFSIGNGDYVLDVNGSLYDTKGYVVHTSPLQNTSFQQWIFIKNYDGYLIKNKEKR